jgi:hypothetical protein
VNIDVLVESSVDSEEVLIAVKFYLCRFTGYLKEDILVSVVLVAYTG